ncbi:TlpA disulfide reductase family protein [Priestia megaterium]|jgi:peroxiredoxin|uniref:TlpA family protein disulfide reductase n=1 Tax=Priestia megaterium TaxID=1404 RepID=UPI0021BE1BBD|nr:TlpA disulfide reductase family protein [Priestia megaterium]MCT9853028.1 TlpA family protein disulfide reductase [Priestia megaterium]MDF1964188.1 TlpA disulfide reductase family protein [Priestia megaterium]
MKKYFQIGALAFVIIIVGFGIWAYNNPQAAIETFFDMGGNEEGESIPLITGKEVNGDTISLKQYEGNKFVVMLGKIDCEVCQKAYPTLEKLKAEHPDTRFVLIGQGSPQAYAKVKKEHGFEFPLISASKDIQKQMNFKTFPVFYLVDKNGVIVKRLNGFDKEKLQNILNEGES